MKQYKRVLTIAGSDSGGGAGVQADIKTISACGCYAASALTAITVQNTLGVSAVHAVPVEILEGQIDAVLSDIGADAIKIGMLHSSEVVRCVRKILDKFDAKNVVLDPVMVSTSGHRLIEEEAIASLASDLLPRARVITPNIPEAEILLGGEKLSVQKELPDAAKRLADKCGASVLLKAGHLTEEKLVDIFYDVEDGKIYELPSARIHTKNTHGTGCTLSSAIASNLAKGFDLDTSVERAKAYISGALGAMLDLGKGSGPMNHAFNLTGEYAKTAEEVR